MAFKRGDRIEVASKEVGFVGSYFPANIIASIPGKASGFKDYIVQYRTLLKDDRSGPLREIVSTDEIRPVPPDVPATVFGVSDVVDVYANDGWWVGKVSGVIGRHYFVYFPTTEEENAYTIDQLRIHQDWVNGMWVLSNN